MPRTHRTPINIANALRQADNFWTDDRVVVLRETAQELSAREIAARIGHGCTRNAVIDKARRLKIKLRSPAGINGLRKEEADKRRKQRLALKIARIRLKIVALQEQIIELEGSTLLRVARETLQRVSA